MSSFAGNTVEICLKVIACNKSNPYDCSQNCTDPAEGLTVLWLLCDAIDVFVCVCVCACMPVCVAFKIKYSLNGIQYNNSQQLQLL